MNETSKKNKVDKCPSTNKHAKSVIDVQKKCILNDKVPDKIELKNGLVNGITSDLTVKKHSRKSKKNKNGTADVNGESFHDKDASKSQYHLQDNCSNQIVHEEYPHQSSKNIIEESSTSKNDVNIVDTVTVKGTKKKKCKVGQLVSNDFSNKQVCDNVLSESKISDLSLKNDLTDKGLNTILQESNVASCSNISVQEVSTESIFSDSKNRKNDIVEITDSLNKIELDSNSTIDSPLTTPKIEFIQYENELQMPMIMKIIQKDLSEPYSIYTYRYFIHNWPKLCFLVSIHIFQGNFFTFLGRL